jgi:hypothetical protein
MRFMAMARHSWASGLEAPERHACGCETLADVLDGLYLVDRNRAFAGGQDFEEIAERHRSVGQNRIHILFVILRLACLVRTFDAHIGVEALEDRRGHGVHLAATTEAVVAGV